VDGVCETTEHFVRRADYATLKGRIKPTEIAKLRQTTGPYAPSFEPHRVRTVRAIAWYARGDVQLLKDWLSHIGHIGGKTAAGYGVVDRWGVEELGASMSDAWYFLDGVLMRPVPIAVFDEAPKGAKPYFGAIKPPYWHPMRQMEVWKPC
jgi:CRISPR type IV-associated protein Csf3